MVVWLEAKFITCLLHGLLGWFWSRSTGFPQRKNLNIAYSLWSQRSLYLPHRIASGLLCLIWHPLGLKATFLVSKMAQSILRRAPTSLLRPLGLWAAEVKGVSWVDPAYMKQRLHPAMSFRWEDTWFPAQNNIGPNGSPCLWDSLPSCNVRRKPLWPDHSCCLRHSALRHNTVSVQVQGRYPSWHVRLSTATSEQRLLKFSATVRVYQDFKLWIGCWGLGLSGYCFTVIFYSIWWN